MPASSSRLSLAVLLLSAIALLLSLSYTAAAATGNNNYSSGGGGRVLLAAATGAASPDGRWKRRLEEEVPPEFSSLAGAGQQQYITYNGLNQDAAACSPSCAAKGASYTHPCTYADKCRGAAPPGGV
ncbi:unnamed protein product [Urochloa humidicola]